MKIRKGSLLAAVAILVLFFLSSCSQRVEMTFYKNNKWVIESENIYSDSMTDFTGEILKSAGVDIGGGSGFTSLTKSVVTGSFNAAKNQLRQMGIDMDWSQKQSGSNTVLKMKLSASSTDKFNRFVSTIGDSVLTEDRSGYYHLQFDIEGANQEILGLFGVEDLESYMEVVGLMSDCELRINAGKIIRSNADEVKGGTAIWYNPSFVDVTFIPKSNIGIGFFLIPLLVIGVVVILVAITKSRKSTCYSCGASVSSGAALCPNCGAEITHKVARRSKRSSQGYDDSPYSSDLDDFFSA